ncbi:MAG: hypothetical protein KIH00_08145 [Lachnospiraceae bacterium]|nr:hypothetical protein [Lachnospiraceae bacterium]
MTYDLLSGRGSRWHTECAYCGFLFSCFIKKKGGLTSERPKETKKIQI